MATLEDEKTRQPDAQDKRIEKERESVTGNRTEQRTEQIAPVDNKTDEGAGSGVSSGRR